MPGAAEILHALYGAWRLARLDRQAMAYFDLSHRGTWRSFWAAALCYPLYLALIYLRLDDQTLAQSSLGHIVLVESIAYVVGWTAFPLVILAFCRALRREEQGFDFITAYNWSQVLQSVLLVVTALISTHLAPRPSANLDIASYLLMLSYEWFIALVAIGAGGWLAGAIVAIDFVLGTIIALVAGSLY
jgi:hypothetical protein